MRARLRRSSGKGIVFRPQASHFLGAYRSGRDMIDVYRHEKALMRRTLISLFLLSILMNSSLVSAEPSSLPPRGVLVGIWEARYKTYYYGEQFDVLTVAQSGQHLSGTYQGYDDFPEDHGPWYFLYG